MKRKLALCLAVIMLIGLVPLAARNAQAATQYATVQGGWLRLRAAASFSAKTIASYYTGTSVKILGTSGKWYNVQVPDGKTGYMYGTYLAMGGSGSTTGTNATVVSANGRSVNMRSGPSTAYRVTASYPVGTAATILDQGTNWCRIRVGTRTGYMMSQFLSTGGTVTPGSGYLARVISSNGLGVRLRAGDSKNAAILGVYSVGTEVTVLKHGATWDYIRVGSRTGYMMNEFLTTSGVTAVITGVKLNNTNPAVGDTLTATTTPSGATVTYRWTDQNGVLLDTGAVHTVTSGEAGRQIRVTVTGTGIYSGAASSTLTSAVVGRMAVTSVAVSDTAPYVGLTISAFASPSGATVTYLWYRDDGVLVSKNQSYTVQQSDVTHKLYAIATGTGSYSGQVASYYTSPVTAQVVSAVLSGSIAMNASVTVGTTVSPVINLNSSNVTYTWYLDGVAYGADSATIQVPDMVGKTLKLRATAKSGSGFSGYVESNTATIQAAPATETSLSGSVTLPDNTSSGATLTPILNLNTTNVVYQWYVNGSPAASATGASYAVTDSDAGKTISVLVSAKSGSGFRGSTTSNLCTVTAKVPDPASGTNLNP